ncbi:MAG TPA: site-specific integrase [Gemmatimonadales bacterium]|nr:site-specific integrase [Gemmatimonadales bacterium]
MGRRAPFSLTYVPGLSFEEFVVSRALSSRTRDLYLRRLRAFGQWCESDGFAASEVSLKDLLRYQEHLVARGAARSSINGVMGTISLYLGWLVKRGVIASSPAEGLRPLEEQRVVRDTLSLEQLRDLWAAATLPLDRVVVALLGFNGMRSDELCAADVSDLTVIDGATVLRIPRRIGSHGFPMTVLAEEISEAIVVHLAGRRSGPLLLASDGKRLDRGKVLRIVRRVSKAAGIPFAVTPMSLIFTMRAQAIERGFSYVGVVRAAGEHEARRLEKMVGRAPQPLSHHAGVRLARLVVGSGSSTLDLLHHAEVALEETDLPPSVAAMTAGAALERHLRLLCREMAVPLTRDERSSQLSTYVAALMGAKVFNRTDHRIATAIADHRGDAAHGWFEDVSADQARWTIREARALALRFPLSTD